MSQILIDLQCISRRAGEAGSANVTSHSQLVSRCGVNYPSESTDSDEVRNDDGDIVVAPPDDWSEANKFGMTAREAEEGESLCDKVAAEEPDMLSGEAPDLDLPRREHRG
jgi:hypothetical protein